MARLIIAGAGLMAAGQIQAGREAAAEGRSAEKIDNYNAILQEREARAIMQKAKFESVRQAEAARRKRAELALWRAGTGATGSELLEAEQEAELELENLLIGYEGRLGAARARSQAELDRLSGKFAKQRGKAARKASYFQAGSTILQGFGVAGMYGKGAKAGSKGLLSAEKVRYRSGGFLSYPR